MSGSTGSATAASRRTGRLRYGGAVLVLLLGLSTLGLGVRAVALQAVSTPPGSQVAAAVTRDDLAPPVPPSPGTASPAVEPARSTPAPTATEREVAEIPFEVVATAETRCWAEGCVLREVTAPTICSSAEATLTVKNANGFETGPNVTQLVGAFAADRPRLVEIDGVQPVADGDIDRNDLDRLEVEVHCLDVDGLS